MTTTRAPLSSRILFRWGEAMKARKTISTCGARRPSGFGAVEAPDGLPDGPAMEFPLVEAYLNNICQTIRLLKGLPKDHCAWPIEGWKGGRMEEWKGGRVGGWVNHPRRGITKRSCV